VSESFSEVIFKVKAPFSSVIIPNALAGMPMFTYGTPFWFLSFTKPFNSCEKQELEMKNAQTQSKMNLIVSL
jgi:hypothetical protein